MALTLPLPFTWAELVDLHVAERGGLTELVRVLYEIHPGALPDDPQSVERGLRRLRKRTGPGDRYGRLLLRHFGLPGRVADQARALGQYHSRLSELSVDVRRDQLRLWDRPPVSESAEAAWIHLGLATLAHREGDREAMARRLELAALGAARAGVQAEIELALFQARRVMDEGDPEGALALLEQVPPLLDQVEDPDDRACLVARRVDQRAYILSRPWRAHPEVLAQAEALYRSIPDDGPAFARFRRHEGLGWCLWRQGRRDEALRQATLAAQAAGDGGYLRLRCLALGLRARVLGPGPEADALKKRVARIRAALGEADADG
ncbi:MAG: hypothetical protein H6739_10745 [Alphaproteobacteria bacterium]|nr:hypothetical protein [Alphaproteobacteria bacterium]